MAKVLLINPSSRGKKRKRAKGPSAKQLAARRKFVAMVRAKAAARKAAAKPKKNPSRRPRKAKARRARTIVPITVKVNPVKRAKGSKSRRRRASRPYRTFRVRAKRNPIAKRGGFVSNTMVPALVGAAGAIINDAAVGAVLKHLPEEFQKPELRHAVKAASAIGLAMIASKSRIASRSLILNGTTGALACVFHDAGRAQVQKLLPNVPMGEYLSEVMGPLPAVALSRARLARGMGEQITWRQNRSLIDPNFASRSAFT